MATKYSRSGSTDPAGKCTERLDIPMSSDLKAALAALGTLSGGKPAAEYAREILAEHVFGRLPLIQRRLGRGGPDWNGSNVG